MSGGADVAVGVDVGSLRAVAAVVRRDDVVEPVRFGGVTSTDAGAFVTEDGRPVAGQPGRQQALHRPQRWVADPILRLTHPPLDIDGVQVEAVDVAAAVFRMVVAEAGHTAGAPVTSARVVVPASWGPRRRTALRTALHRAGVGSAELIEGPIAVAWHMVAGGVQLPVGAAFVVCDFGAGFSATVVTRTAGGFEVLASIDVARGGGHAADAAVAAALDDAVAHAAASRPATDAGTGLPGTAVAVRDLEALDRARLAKETLSASSTVAVSGPAGAVLFGLEQFRTAMAPVLAAAVAATRQAIDAADIAAEQIHFVVCAGGGARMPVVADALHAGLGVRPYMLTQPDLAAAFGAVQAPLADHTAQQPDETVPSAADARTAVVAASGSVLLFGQFLAGTERYGPRESILPGMLLANWAGLATAALLAAMAAAAGAAWWTAARHGALEDTRLRHRLYGAATLAAAAIGAGVAVGYAIIATSYLDATAGPLLRWSVLAVLPVTIAVAAAGALVLRRPDPPHPHAHSQRPGVPSAAVGESWLAWFRVPAVVAGLIGVGAFFIGYDVTGSPSILAPLQWLLERTSMPSQQIIGVVGRLGGACLGAAVAVLLTRRLRHLLFTVPPLAGLTAVATTWRSTGLIAIAVVVVVAGWWVSRIVAASVRSMLQPAATPRPAAHPDPHPPVPSPTADVVLPDGPGTR